MEPKYKRILIKLSGEALAGEKVWESILQPFKLSQKKLLKYIVQVLKLLRLLVGEIFGVENQLLQLVWIAYKPITLVC